MTSVIENIRLRPAFDSWNINCFPCQTDFALSGTYALCPRSLSLSLSFSYECGHHTTTNPTFNYDGRPHRRFLPAMLSNTLALTRSRCVKHFRQFPKLVPFWICCNAVRGEAQLKLTSLRLCQGQCKNTIVCCMSRCVSLGGCHLRLGLYCSTISADGFVMVLFRTGLKTAPNGMILENPTRVIRCRFP